MDHMSVLLIEPSSVMISHVKMKINKQAEPKLEKMIFNTSLNVIDCDVKQQIKKQTNKIFTSLS